MLQAISAAYQGVYQWSELPVRMMLSCPGSEHGAREHSRIPQAGAGRCDHRAACCRPSVSRTRTFSAGRAIARPRIAVAGLNPACWGRRSVRAWKIGICHCSRRSSSRSARRAWTPAVRTHRTPCSCGLVRATFDVVVAMYHDQGLIPVKLLGLDEWCEHHVGAAIRAHQPRPWNRFRYRRDWASQSPAAWWPRSTRPLAATVIS